jgi:hypothetical protein
MCELGQLHCLPPWALFYCSSRHDSFLLMMSRGPWSLAGGAGAVALAAVDFRACRRAPSRRVPCRDERRRKPAASDCVGDWRVRLNQESRTEYGIGSEGKLQWPARLKREVHSEICIVANLMSYMSFVLLSVGESVSF